MLETIKSYARAGVWLLLTIILAAFVGWLHVHQLGVLVWSLLKLTAGAYLGYWIDRTIFYYARPGHLTGEHRNTASIRRAIIMAATIVALGLGV